MLFDENTYALVINSYVKKFLNLTKEQFQHYILLKNETLVHCDITCEIGMYYDAEKNSFYWKEKDVEPEKTQLDLIQELVEQHTDELKQEGADLMMTELQKRGILS